MTSSMPEGEKGVSDSNPLIWLAKSGRLDLLRRLFGVVLVPPVVREEVLRGDSADVVLIGEAFREGWLRVGSSEGGLELGGVSGLHSGEADAVLLARGFGALFLVDDREASAVARVLGVQCLGTVGVLLLGLSMGLFGFDDFVECLNRMVGLGFRLGVEVYRGALEEAKRLATE